MSLLIKSAGVLSASTRFLQAAARQLHSAEKIGLEGFLATRQTHQAKYQSLKGESRGGRWIASLSCDLRPSTRFTLNRFANHAIRHLHTSAHLRPPHAASFVERIERNVNSEETSEMIFTEDLKNMVYLMENNAADIGLFRKMLTR